MRTSARRCSGNATEGTPGPFYLRLVAPPHASECTWVHAMPTCLVTFHTAPVSMDQCFRHGEVHYKRLPLTHADHPFNSDSGLRRLLRRALTASHDTHQVHGLRPWLTKSDTLTSHLNVSTTTRRRLATVLSASWMEQGTDTAIATVGDVARGVPGTASAAGRRALWTLEGWRDLADFEMNWNPQTRSALQQGLSLWNSGGLRVQCNNCFARIESGIYFIMILKGTWFFPFVYVDYMKFEVYGNLRMSLDATVTTSTRVDVWSNPVILTPNVRVASITFPVALIPVRISFAVGLQARTKVSTTVAGSASLAFDYARHVSYATIYTSQWGQFRGSGSSGSNGLTVRPLRLSMSGSADLAVALLPTLTATLWGVAPFVVQPAPLVGVQLTPRAGGCSGVLYQMFVGMDLRLGMERIYVPIPFTSWVISLGGSTLPWYQTFTLVGKMYLQCLGCSGCLATANRMLLPAAATPSGEWSVGEWGQCSKTCGGGEQERTVRCWVPATRAYEPDSLCLAVPKPATSQGCNQQACGLRPCPTNCTAAMLSNTKCDEECMGAECGYDNGRCAQQQAIASACSSQTSCAGCLGARGVSCGWCTDKGRGSCRDGDAAGPSSGTCGGSWWVTQCQPDEPPLALACPSSLKAGATTTLAWEGGPAAGKVVLYLRVLDTAVGALPASGRHLRSLPVNSSFHHFVNMAAASRRQLGAGGADNDEVQLAALVTGFGIPAGPIDNTGSFNWTLLPGLPSSSYQLLIASASTPTNFALSNHTLNINGTSASITLLPCTTGPCITYTWSTNAWSQCSKDCGRGTQSRVVVCMASEMGQVSSVVADRLCSGAGRRPAGQQACNTAACQETPLNLRPLPLGLLVPAGGQVELAWSGGLQYSWVQFALQQVASGVAGQLPVSGPWQVSGLGLPVAPWNMHLGINWTVPSSLPSGQYLLKIVSRTTPSNQDVLDTPLLVQGAVTYDVTLIPNEHYMDLESHDNMQLVIYGSHGQTEAMDLTLSAAGDAGGGACSIALQGLDVGLVQHLRLTKTATYSRPALAAVVVHSLGRTYEAGFVYPPTPTEVDNSNYHHHYPISEVELPTCQDHSSSCFACTSTPGCGWCQSSGQCMAVGPGGSSSWGPAWGDCPEASWAPAPAQCFDACQQLATCDTCVAIVGCGWCASSCSCRSSDAQLIGDALPGACPAPSFVPQLAIGGACGAQAGATCISSPQLRAVPTATVHVYDGVTYVYLAGYESTPCATCATANCGPNSVCVAKGIEATCVCTDGYSGSDCSQPPGPCFNVTCSGHGVCMQRGATGTCACRPGYSGEDCSLQTAPPQPAAAPPRPTIVIHSSTPRQLRSSGASQVVQPQASAQGGHGHSHGLSRASQPARSLSLGASKQAGPRPEHRKLLLPAPSCYTWTITQEPPASTASIEEPSALGTFVSDLVPGAYTFQLSVLDNSGGLATANVTVVVQAGSTPPPFVDWHNGRRI